MHVLSDVTNPFTKLIRDRHHALLFDASHAQEQGKCPQEDFKTTSLLAGHYFRVRPSNKSEAKGVSRDFFRKFAKLDCKAASSPTDMTFSTTVCLWLLLISMATAELIQNGGFESLSHWDCWSPVHCSLSNTKHSGHHAVKVTGR